MANPSPLNQPNYRPLTQLRQQMAHTFSLEELRTLCFDLHINFDELPHSGLTPKIFDLLLWLKQNDRLADLLTYLALARPHITWPAMSDLLVDTWPDADSTPSGTVLAQGDEAVAVGPRGVYISGDVHGNIYTGDVINYYLTGTRTYFPQLRVGIENFLINYLGTDKQPVPFGGRDQQIEQLDNWLTQSKTQRLLLVAPAGRGKSALLIRWSQKLTIQKNIDVVFMPISVRFNTNREDNTFVLLATRLAHFYGKQIPTDYANLSPQVWRGLVAEYLREPLPESRQLLLILDGLDEAAWDVAGDLLPLNLPETIRVVISARYLGGEEQNPLPWLRRLGWDGFQEVVEAIELKELTQEGVRDVLEKMGCPLDELSQNVDVVTELHRLSQGDPLLVELYVKDLWQRGRQGEAVARIKPEGLLGIEPGYKGYFDRWWDEQGRLWGTKRPLQEPLVRAILNLLTVAHGPLVVDEIQSMLPETIMADGLLIKEAITPLSRFVIGDGHKQGYVFAHPKLADYFGAQLTPRDKMAWRTRFLVWGEQTLSELRAKQVRPWDVSRYLMLYYGRHLEEMGAEVEVLLSLVTWEWVEVWHEKTGTYAGFLQDVDRVWGRLCRENESAARQEKEIPYLGQEILCALCHATVNTLANNIHNKLLALLLRYRIWTEEQIVAYVRRRTDISERIEGFALLSEYLLPGTKEPIWQELLEAVWQIQNEKDRTSILAMIAPHCPLETLKMGGTIKNEVFRVEVLMAVAPYLPEATLLELQRLNRQENQADVLKAIAPYLPRETLMATRAISHELSQAKVLLVLASYLPQEILMEVSRLESKLSQVEILMAIAPHLPEETLAVMSEISDESSKACILASAIPYLPVGTQVVLSEVALIAVVEKRHEWALMKVLAAIAPYVPERVLMVAHNIRNEMMRIKVILAVAPHLPEKVLEVVQEIRDKEGQMEILLAIVRHISDERRSAVLEEVITIMHGIKSESRRADVMAIIANYLPEERRTMILNEFWVSIDKTTDAKVRARLLMTLVPHFSLKRCKEVLKEELERVQGIHDEWSVSDVSAICLPYLPIDMHKVALSQILNLMQKTRFQEWNDSLRAGTLLTLASHLPIETLEWALYIESEWIQADVLRAVAPYLPKEVLAIARELRNEENRMVVLIAIAPYLPEEVLVDIREMRHALMKADVLVAIAPKQPEEVLVLAQEISDPEQRAKLLATIVPFLPVTMRTDVLDQVLTCARELREQGGMAEILALIVYQLPKEKQAVLMDEVLGAIRMIKDERERAYRLKRIAPYLPLEALRLTQEMRSPQNRVDVLQILTQYLPDEMQPDVWEQILGTISDVEGKLISIAGIRIQSAQIGSFSKDHLYKLWRKRLLTFSQYTRPQLLSEIKALMPIVYQLGGAKAVCDTWQIVQTVTTWWP